MVSYYKNLSTCESVTLSSNMDNINFKKYSRYFNGGYVFNFYNALSAVSDYKYKNYTNFFLTRNTTLNNIIEKDFDILKSDSLLTSLNFGNIYLQYNDPDSRILGLSGIYTNYDQYGAYSFTDVKNLSTNFTISLKDDNTCNVYYTKNYKKYYLTVDNNSNVNFYTKKLNLSGINFNYIYSRPNKAIFLFYNSGSSTYFLRKDGNNLTLATMTSANKLTVYNNPIYLSKDIYTNFDIDNSTTYVRYESDNTISDNGILKKLNNNYLLHRENDSTDVIILKNQLTQNDTFTSGNILLSSDNLPFFVDNLRNYTSIFSDVNTERDDDLSLNYVFYNKSYKITPGENIIIAPDNMTPFSVLNINDTKFVDCGAFAYPSPEYADKVYRKDTSIDYSDNQIYLCTWLSGSPLSDHKVWVDRYYYPDKISKQNALQGNNTFNLTYEDIVEQQIKNNLTIQSSVSSFLFYDKKSDMVFVPEETYIYDRINSNTISSIISTNEVSPCQNLDQNYNTINYFKTLNEQGLFTVSFYFEGNNSNWVFQSKRNNINGGLKVDKSGEYLNFEMNLYDPSNGGITSFTKSIKYKPLKDNFVCISVDSIKGVGYFFLNTEVITTFSFDKYQFYNKKVLFGDFVIDGIDVYSSRQNIIKDIQIKSEYSIPELAFITPIIQGKSKIDDIYITLPCGMRNSSDNIEFLQSVCSNQTFKSNHINIHIKNTDLDNDTKEKISNKIKEKIVGIAPLTTEINNIKFENYK